MTVTDHRPATQATNEPTYEQNLRTLSEASVHQHFDAFLDIDWDNPDFAIRADDERRRGASRERVRNKIVDIDELLRVAQPGRTRPRYAATRRKRENRG